MSALLLLSACGSGSGSKTSGPRSGDSASSAAMTSFMSLGKRGGSATVKVVYDVTGPDAQQRITYAQRPPKRSFRQQNSDADTFIIADGPDLIACSADACYRIKGLGGESAAAGAAFFGAITEALGAFDSAPDLPGFISGASRTIIGKRADCGSWRASFSKGIFEACLDHETGVPLAFTIRADDGTRSLVAQSVASPADADFTPSHSVEELPTDFATAAGSPS